MHSLSIRPAARMLTSEPSASTCSLWESSGLQKEVTLEISLTGRNSKTKKDPWFLHLPERERRSLQLTWNSTWKSYRGCLGNSERIICKCDSFTDLIMLILAKEKKKCICLKEVPLGSMWHRILWQIYVSFMEKINYSVECWFKNEAFLSVIHWR